MELVCRRRMVDGGDTVVMGEGAVKDEGGSPLVESAEESLLRRTEEGAGIGGPGHGPVEMGHKFEGSGLAQNTNMACSNFTISFNEWAEKLKSNMGNDELIGLIDEAKREVGLYFENAFKEQHECDNVDDLAHRATAFFIEKLVEDRKVVDGPEEMGSCSKFKYSKELKGVVNDPEREKTDLGYKGSDGEESVEVQRGVELEKEEEVMQIGPYMKIDMRSGEIDGYDAVFLSPHKFLGGPGTPGILMMSKILYQLGSSPPSTCGGGTVDFANPYNEKDTLYVENIEEREDAGTPPIIQKIRAALAFWVKEFIGQKVIERLEHTYINEALERLLPNPNVWVLGNVTAKRQAVLSYLIYTTTYSLSADINGQDKQLYLWRESGNMRDKPLHGPFVAKLLNDLFGIQARGGCACAGPYGHSLLNVDQTHSLAFRSAIEKQGYTGVKPGWTRISFPYYMSKEEFEFTIAALEFLAIYAQRFLPLYSFNWKTGGWTFKKKALKEILLGNGKQRNGEFGGSIFKDDGGLSLSISSKYAKYLETAKWIASLLPKFPPQKPIPQEIDPHLIPFRV
nr:probable cysteine desulfurase [Ipomoea batatas]